MKNNRTLFELSTEMDAAAALMDSLQCNIDEDNTGDKLTESRMRLAMFGISHYIRRISKEIEEIDARYDMRERTVRT